jgi:ribosomal-protein-alanine N-acetyltransferase
MSPAFTLREGRLDDIDAIVAIDRMCDIAPHWPPAAFASIFLPTSANSTQRHLAVAETQIEEAGPLAGFAVVALHRTSAETTAELEDVAVAPQERRNGIGHALCAHAIEWAQGNGATSIALEVRATSAGAIALYAALGFRETGCRPHYYSDPQDDALHMLLTISPPVPPASPA